MTNITWTNKIRKGGSSNTGWISIPKELLKKTNLKQWYNVKILDKKNVLNLHLNIKKLKSAWGFYIPKKICEKHNLLEKTVVIKITPSNYFRGKISVSKRIRLPNELVKSKKVKHTDLYEIELISDTKIYREVVLITVTNRSNEVRADEYFFTLRLSKIPKRQKEVKVRLLRKIEKLEYTKNQFNKECIYIPDLFQKAIIGKIDKKNIIIFSGNHFPIKTPINIKIREIIHYFGCYYADGTKKGLGWSINASTPEQAKYYCKMYKKLILNQDLEFQLTYSKKPSNVEDKFDLKNKLKKYWGKESLIELKQDKIHIYNAKSDKTKKWNPHGTLRIRDNRSLVLELHNHMLTYIIDYLKKETERKQLWAFLMGLLEGDGYVAGGKNRVGIGLTTNINQDIIGYVLSKLEINYTTEIPSKEGKGKTVQIRIWQKEVERILPEIANEIFKYYPKRRKMLLKRLLSKPTIRKLLKKDLRTVTNNTEKELILCLSRLKKEEEQERG